MGVRYHAASKTVPRHISVLLQLWVAGSSLGLQILGRIQAVGVAAMYMGSPRGILYGCSEWFKAFVMTIIPHVVQNERAFMNLENSQRRQDFIEVFSGRANLSAQMREASWLGIGTFSGLHTMYAIRQSFSCLSFTNSKSHRVDTNCKAGFVGLTYDKIDDPSLNFSSDEGRAECTTTEFGKHVVMCFLTDASYLRELWFIKVVKCM